MDEDQTAPARDTPSRDRPITDTDRLEWMIKFEAKIIPYSWGYAVRLVGSHSAMFLRRTPREVIDAAMERII